MRGATTAGRALWPFLPFQSTRPVRGATKAGLRGLLLCVISIHAPRAGRDPQLAALLTAVLKFQSTRPVRGATPNGAYAFIEPILFQSTRPVRGATAKVYKITLHTFATKGNF